LKSLCGNWLFRSPFVHIFSIEDPLKNKKRKKKKKKRKKREKGLIFAFKVSCPVVRCDFVCVQAHFSSTV
jgi:hypothetical protein